MAGHSLADRERALHALQLKSCSAVPMAARSAEWANQTGTCGHVGQDTGCGSRTTSWFERRTCVPSSRQTLGGLQVASGRCR